MLRPIQAEYEGKVETFYCHHWRQFPPVSALLSLNVEQQRAEGLITTAGYEQHKVWERVCGQAQGMSAEVCLSCPHVRKLVSQGRNKPPLFVSLDGKHSFPVVDSADIATRGGSRGSLNVAAGKTRSATIEGKQRDESVRSRFKK